MTKFNKFALLVLPMLVSLSLTTNAHARPSDGELILSIFGVVNEDVDTVEAGNDARDESYNFGFGGLVEANINGFLGIETGAMFVKRQYEVSGTLGSVVQQTNRIHVPVLVKFWPTNFLYVGAGPYASFKTGSVNTALNAGNTPIGDINTSADDDVEIGYDLSLGVNFAVAGKTGIFVEARYSSPFESEDSERYEELTALAGVKLAL